MGRRKILINQITDHKLRNITFLKRKQGLIKKAAELSLLCNVNMLLIFEDGNGNLIQFSRNKITTIPSFFKECTYSSVSEFTANDYPNFFNGNQKRKRRGRKNDEEANKEAVTEHTEQEDEFPVFEDLTQMTSEAQSSQKGENITIAPSSTYEDFLSPGMVSYSSSEEPSHDERDEIHTIPDIQMREPYDHQPQCMMSKSEEIGRNDLEEKAPCLNKRESYQNYKDMPMRDPIIEDKPIDYIQPQTPYKRPIPRRSFIEDRPHHPYRNYPFEYDMPHYADYPPNHWPYNYYHDPYSQRFSHYMRPKSRVFCEMSEEEAVDGMFRYPPKGHGMDSSDHKSERNEFIHMSENYVKTRERSTNNAHPNYQEINPHHYSSAYYTCDGNISSNPEENLSVPFFSSEKFNSKGYTFESDSFNEFSDPQKKIKQG